MIWLNLTNQEFQEIDTTSNWENKGIFSLSLAQAALINWAAGGENNFAVNGLVKYFSNYNYDKISWENIINVGYGFMKQSNERYRKTDDKLLMWPRSSDTASTSSLNYTCFTQF